MYNRVGQVNTSVFIKIKQYFNKLKTRVYSVGPLILYYQLPFMEKNTVAVLGSF